MWTERDRRSSQSTPAHTTPHSRPYSPAQSRPTRGPGPLPPRPSVHPRSSSLSLASTPNVSVTNLHTGPQIPRGSSLRNEVRNPTPYDVPDPLQVLSGILSRSLKTKNTNGEAHEASATPELVADIDFGGLSLEDFLQRQEDQQKDKTSDVRSYTLRSIEEYDKEKGKFEDLHKSIAACDHVLQSVETYLTGFQADLGNVSAEIETLQSRSSAMNTKLENRKVVEKLLGPSVEDLSLPPLVVRKISEGNVDEAWTKALADLEKRHKAVEMRRKEQQTPLKAMEDLLPLLENLTHKAVERIRDYFVAQIKALRSPSINAQIIQKDHFLKYKDLFSFLARHQRKLAEEIGQAYINTIRWYYLNHFTRYESALKAMRLHNVDKNDLIGQQDDPGLKKSTKSGPATHDAFSLGRRMDALKAPSRTALPSYLAEEDKSAHCLETPFRSFNLALIDNACFEYAFLSSFFAPTQNFHAISRTFETIFAPTFSLGQAFTKSLVGDPIADALGVLLCVRLNGQMAFELQRRKVPAAEGYVNGTNILLWPRFQQVMDLNCESLKRVTAALSGRSGASSLLSSSASTATAQSTAPHPLTQRFASFLLGILTLGSEAGDGDEPVSRSLGRLRGEYENFLMKLSKSVGDARKRERFLYNNFSLVGTILEEAGGSKLAQEMREYFAGLKETYCG